MHHPSLPHPPSCRSKHLSEPTPRLHPGLCNALEDKSQAFASISVERGKTDGQRGTQKGLAKTGRICGRVRPQGSEKSSTVKWRCLTARPLRKLAVEAVGGALLVPV